MCNATHPLSSRRRRGPTRRVFVMWHSKRDFESSVIMGPRFRGDDAETALACSFVEVKTLPTEPDMKSFYAEEFLPKQ
jgi:hypothetical protein